MPIPIAAARQHVDAWSDRLGARGHWAKHLFFSADVTAAAEILKSGQLVCRADLGCVARDIANQEALAVNPEAHRYVRLYFRPKTDFHLRTEGIKLLSDRYRLEHHMSVPVMFVFRLPSVVTLPGTCFSNRKMAHAGLMPGNNLEYFNRINFEKVYHEAPISDAMERQEINDVRMAEVLIPRSLSLADHIEWVLCRTQLDAITLCHLVGEPNQILENRLRVSTRPSEMFFCWGAYIEEADVTGDILAFRVKSSRDYRPSMELKFRIQRFQAGLLTQQWEVRKALSGKALRLRGFEVETGGHWHIEIEDALAFCGELPKRADSIYRA